MKTKVVLGLCGAVLAFGAGEARADFISLPLQCAVRASGAGEAGIRVAVKKEGGKIFGVLLDGNDRARLSCARVVDEQAGLPHLECTGAWESDGSAAALSASLYTYVPFVNVQRSESSFGGSREAGICFGR